jgi:hypothetical protein
MSDSSILIQSERAKSWSTNLTRLRSGSVAYALADFYFSSEWKISLLPPLLAGVFLSWLGWEFLGRLVSEK